jgi:hypothetical protein
MQYLKIKFGELKQGDLFLYNGLLYSKANESEGFNQRFGLFTINPGELVDILANPTNKTPKYEAFVLAVCSTFAIITIYFIGECLCH